MHTGANNIINIRCLTG